MSQSVRAMYGMLCGQVLGAGSMIGSSAFGEQKGLYACMFDAWPKTSAGKK